jgi:hypothetical protein
MQGASSERVPCTRYQNLKHVKVVSYQFLCAGSFCVFVPKTVQQSLQQRKVLLLLSFLSLSMLRHRSPESSQDVGHPCLGLVRRRLFSGCRFSFHPITS